MKPRFNLALTMGCLLALVLGGQVSSDFDLQQASTASLTSSRFELSGLEMEGVSDTGSNVELVGHIGGPARAVAVQGGYAYVGMGAELAVMDIRDPARPKRAGYVLTPGEVQNIMLQGNYAYVAFRAEDRAAGMQVIDVSNPAVPILMSSNTYTDCAFNSMVAVSGATAYLGVTACQYFSDYIIQNAGVYLYVVDASNPENQLVVNEHLIMMMNAIWSLAVAGDYAYVFLEDELRVLDISDPQSVSEISATALPGDAVGVSLAGNYAYLAIADGGLAMLDITDPSAPALLDGLALPGYINSVFVSGDFAYMACSQAGLRIVDVSDPNNLNEVGFYLGQDAVLDVQAVGTAAYVANDWGGLSVLDISDPAAPGEIGAWEPPQQVNALGEANGVAYIAAQDGLWVLDVSDPIQPTLVSNQPITATVQDVVIAGQYAFLAASENGLRVFDVSDPLNPYEAGWLDTPGIARDLSLTGDTLYLVEDEGVLRIINVAEPTLPFEMGYYTSPVPIVDVAVQGSIAYLALLNGNLQVVDATNPAVPIPRGSFNPPDNYPNQQATSLAIEGNLAYLTTTEVPPTHMANTSGKYWIIDLTNPDLPAQVFASPLRGEEAWDIQVSGNIIYVAWGHEGLQVIDAADPGAPSVVGSYDLSEEVVGVSLADGNIYTWRNSLHILRYVDPDLPAIGGQVSQPNGEPKSGVQVQIEPGLYDYTDKDGLFSFTGLITGTYSLAPGLAGSVFSPAERVVDIPPSNMEQDFTILAAPVMIYLPMMMAPEP